MRPLGTIHRAVLLPLLAVGALALSAGLAPLGAAAQDFDAAGEQQMLARINAMRAAQNLAPLSRHPGLDAAARAHSTDMAAHGALTHVSETSGTPADRVRAAGVGANTIAENVALHRSTDAAHDALLASEAHNANMMNADVSHVGLAALRTAQGVYVTQVFAAIAAPAPAVAAAPPAPAPAIARPAPAPAAPPARVPPPAEAEPAEVDEAAPGEECVSPVPGVRFCGRLPRPSVQRQVEAAPPPPAVAAPAPAAPPANGGLPPGHRLEVQPGTNGTVIHEREGSGRVVAYWVYGSGRWWYYPMPAGAQPGQQLQPDLRVSGPPPGFPAHPFGGPPTAQPLPPMQAAPRAWPVAPPPPVAMPMAPPPPPPGAIVIGPYGGAQITVGPPGGFYAVPPPPMMGAPDRAWRRAHGQWNRAYQRWVRDQARMRRRAL